jgi:hypothetical protein
MASVDVAFDRGKNSLRMCGWRPERRQTSVIWRIVSISQQGRSSCCERVLAIKDPHDRHIVVAAFHEDCDYICTANTRDCSDGTNFKKLKFITPKRLYHKLLVAI